MTLDELIRDEKDEARAEGLSDALKILGISREEFEKNQEFKLKLFLEPAYAYS